LFIFDLDQRLTATLVFSTMVLAQLLHTFHFRVESASIFSRQVFQNRPLLLAVAASIILQLAVVYFPPAQLVFGTEAMALWHWGLVLAGAVIPLVAIDTAKRFGLAR
jgi:Ca2+-transporting ATPase